MKIKLYLNDWFINMGIIGFLRIIQNADKINQMIIKDNYVEFDNNILKDFHKDFFLYFLKRYDIAKRECAKLDKYLIIAKNKEKFKDAVKWSKENISYNKGKIKGKFINKIYEEKCNEIYTELGKIKDFNQYNDFKDLINSFEGLINNKEVNDKLSTNFIRSILSSDFFGQASFLQKTCAKKTAAEQANILYDDYIKPIFEECEFYEQIEDSENINQINILKQENLSKEFKKILKEIPKDIKRGSIEDLKSYLNNNMQHCSIWNEYLATSDYSEGMFLPLAVSTSNSKNFMWNFNTSYPVCNLIKLILLCTPAGVTDMDEGYFGFVNMDTSVEDLFKCNENFRMMNSKDNPYEDLIYDIVDKTSKKSIWTLENILFIEFSADYNSKKCKLNYFNISKPIAIYFKDYAKKDFEKVKDKQFKKDMVSLILNNKAIKTITYKNSNNEKDISIADNINTLIDIKLRNDIRKNISFEYDALIGTIAYYKINLIRKGFDKVDSKKIWSIFKSGQELNAYYVDKDSENKIQGIAYKLLNASKAGNKNDFMDSLLRIYMSANKEVPTLFLNIMHEKDLDFQTVAHAFISGFISKEKTIVKKEEN